MTIKPTIATYSAIRAAAIAKGYADASIVRQCVPGEHCMDAGAWFVLSIKRSADSEWEAIGRRRTKAELWRILETREIAGT